MQRIVNRAWHRLQAVKGFAAALACCVLLAGFALYGAVRLSDAFSGALDQPEIGYATLPVTDRVAQLNRKIEAGEVSLDRQLVVGYLPAVLAALNVPVESQMVVFSRDSLQQRIIYPDNPRSIFFNDSVAVGWVRGEPFVEVAAQDPRQGIHFYTLSQSDVHPQFLRQDKGLCLNCHESFAALDIPGMLVRSSPVGADGMPDRDQGNYVTDHRSGFEERWGGWFVTGGAGSMRHLGNVAGGAALKPFAGEGYLAKSSDVVALMVFDHQMRMMNLITRLGWEFRVRKPEELEEPVREFVDYLLFKDEAPLASPVRGESGFAEKFAAQGPRDAHGRGLRDFDLQRRLMRYPCSYMIYSEAFDGMPEAAREAVYRRMWTVLSADSRPEAKAVIEILRATKPGLPEYWMKR